MRPTKYFFGRLHLAGSGDDKYAFLLNGLRTRKTVSFRKYLWGFFDVSEITQGSQQYIHGFLAKLAPVQAEEVADLETHHLGQADVKNRIIAKARFFIQPDSSLITFHRDGSHIAPHHFRRYFAEVFREAYDNLFVDAEVQLIEERFDFIERLARFQSIRVLELTLHPTNPNYDQFYERVDRRLRELEAEKYQERYELQPDASPDRIREDEDIRSKVLMAEDGYGEARVAGTVDGRSETISTSQNPVTGTVPSNIEEPTDIVGILGSIFRQLIDRVRQ